MKRILALLFTSLLATNVYCMNETYVIDHNLESERLQCLQNCLETVFAKLNGIKGIEQIFTLDPAALGVLTKESGAELQILGNKFRILLILFLAKLRCMSDAFVRLDMMQKLTEWERKECFTRLFSWISKNLIKLDFDRRLATWKNQFESKFHLNLDKYGINAETLMSKLTAEEVRKFNNNAISLCRAHNVPDAFSLQYLDEKTSQPFATIGIDFLIVHLDEITDYHKIA